MCIHLLSTINGGYEVPFRVTVQSYLDHCGDATAKWHVFESDLPAESRHAIEDQAAGYPLKFYWYDFKGSLPANLPVRGHFVPHVYARILAPRLLPAEVRRFLYLDGDLLILDRITDLWNTDLQGAVIGAVPDMAVPHVSSPMGLRRFRELGFQAADPYFNAGVYLADTAAWRARETGRLALEYLDSHRDDVNLLDQDALNAVLRGLWKPLDLRWNLISGLAGRPFFNSYEFDEDEYRGALAEPGIVHFAGLLKPWVHPRIASRWSGLYLQTLARVFPDHQLSRSLSSRSFAFYDRRLRRMLYPVEKFVWSKRRGF